MSRFKTTKTVSAELGVSYSRLARLLWLNEIDVPERGPGGCYLWDDDAINKASWQILGHAYRPRPKVGNNVV